MDKNLLPLISVFVEVSKVLSFTQASKNLGVSASALSQSISTLEQALSVRLLNRSTRSVSLTEAGLKLLEEVRPSLETIASSLLAIQDMTEEPSGVIRLNSSRICAKHYIQPYLAEFYQKYPKISFEFAVDDRFTDIIQAGFDAGIRLRESVTDSMIAIPLGQKVSMAVVASPEYFERTKIPKHPDELESMNCIAYRAGPMGALHRWNFEDPKDQRRFTIEPKGSLNINDDEIMLDLARSGLGVVCHMDFAVQEDLKTGRLIRVLEEWCPSLDGFDLYIPTREKVPAKVKAFADFLRDKRRKS